MTWEELIKKLKDTNIDLTNEFKINKYADITKKKTQKEFEKFGITQDIVYIQAINGLIYSHIYNEIFKNVNIDFESHPLEAIVYRKVVESMEDIRNEFISLFENEDGLIDFFRNNKI